MNIAKRLVSCLLALTILLGLCASALAITTSNEGQYQTTRAFIKKLNAESLKYTYLDIESNKNEHVRVVFESKEFDSITFDIFFDEDEDGVGIRVWNLVKVKSSKNYALNAVNSLNYQYKYARFYLDETDDTVTCSMDAYLDEDCAGAVTYRMLMVLMDIITDDDCVEALKSLQ